jgi:hypothetical protein
MAQVVKDSFRLQVKPLNAEDWLSYESRGVLLGSCFASEIGNRLYEDGFDILVNPYGTVYNPISTLNTCTLTWEEVQVGLVERDGGYTSHLLHSDVWAKNIDELKAIFHYKREALALYFKKCTWVSITLGTAWMYERIQDGLICSNLHKVPAHSFKRRLLTIEEILEAWDVFYITAREHGITKFVITVSPVLHGKDGLTDNSVSKALLRVAAEYMATDEGVTYFPSLEIVRDELRDYRFYAEDMMHPSAQATDIVYDRFSTYAIEKKALEIRNTFREIRQFAKHLPREIDAVLYENRIEVLRTLPISEKKRIDVITLLEKRLQSN